MKKIESPKRLTLRRETLLALTQLTHVVGGGALPPTKAHVSCVLVCPTTPQPCVPSVPCETQLGCELQTAHC